jgi:hypothetical protein
MVELYETAITPGCREGLAYLRHEPFLRNYYLAGGTGLALQLGHRISTDLDWFSTNRRLLGPEREHIGLTLGASGAFQVALEQDGMLFAKLFGTDVSFVHQPHALLEPTIDHLGVQLASPTDIGLMKIAAINSRGTRRDFVDVYCLRETVTLDRLLELSTVKYSDRPSFLAIAIRALAYFEDAEHQPMPRLLWPVRWTDVREYCETSVRRVSRRLSRLDREDTGSTP